jgi:hypothetical protein
MALLTLEPLAKIHLCGNEVSTVTRLRRVAKKLRPPKKLTRRNCVTVLTSIVTGF